MHAASRQLRRLDADEHGSEEADRLLHLHGRKAVSLHPHPILASVPLHQLVAPLVCTREELKAAGRDRPDIKEVARLWNLLPEQERREWDNKAREEEKRYIQELRDRPDGASAEGEEAAGVSQAGDESDEEERNLLALQLPFGAHSSHGRTAPCSRRVPRRPPHAPPPFPARHGALSCTRSPQGGPLSCAPPELS